jgi:membrane fusion protein (multidrug efflux system)
MDGTPGQFYIVTDGLKSGDRIIAEGANNLRDGLEIKPVDVSAESVYKALN